MNDKDTLLGSKDKRGPAEGETVRSVERKKILGGKHVGRFD
jgi:hypothetical protein